MERYSLEYWKDLAIERRMEIKAQVKRVKEITLSRDLWKIKWIKERDNNVIYKNELKQIKKKLFKILSSTKTNEDM